MALTLLLVVILFSSELTQADPCDDSGKLQPTLALCRSEKLVIDTGLNTMYICDDTSDNCSREAKQKFSGYLVQLAKPYVSRFCIADNIIIFGTVILKGTRAISLQSCYGNILINSSSTIEGSCSQASATKEHCLGGATGTCGQYQLGKGGGGYGGKCTKKSKGKDFHHHRHKTTRLLGGEAGCVNECWYKSIGGGAIELLAKNGTIQIESQIDVSSTNKQHTNNCTGKSGGGGGGGGTIRLIASKIYLSEEKILKANGGAGFGGRGGGGGGGIIQIIATETLDLHKNAIVVQGGSNKTAICEPGLPGYILLKVNEKIRLKTTHYAIYPPDGDFQITDNNKTEVRTAAITSPLIQCHTSIRVFEEIDLIGRARTIPELEKYKVNPTNAEIFTKKIRELTSPKNLTPRDIRLTARILENIARSRPNFTQAHDFIWTISNILDANNGVWDEGETSLRFIQSLNLFLGNVSLGESASLRSTAKYLTAYVTEINSSRNLTANSGAENWMTASANSTSRLVNASFRFPQSENVLDGLRRVIFIFYGDTKLFQTIKCGNPRAVLSGNVVAVRVKGQKIKDLANPVEIKVRRLSKDKSEKVSCVFWNAGKTMQWSTEGCRYKGKDGHGMDVCHCDHLTNFALLMDVLPDENTKNKGLSIITYVGGSISIAGLLITMATILIYTDFRRKLPTQILFNICFSLLITFLAFLISAKRENTASLNHCRAVSILLHYSVLATFAWICVDSYTMYLAFVKVLPQNVMEDKLPSIRWCCIIAWGVPAIIVGSTTAWALNYYGNEQFCILSGVAFLGTFVGPVALSILINSSSFVFIVHGLLTSGRGITASQKATGLQKIKRVICIFVTFGLTWVFGVLAVKSVKAIFQYLFCILNSFQGFLIFLFYCALSEETRTKYKNSWNQLRGNGRRRRPPSIEIRLANKIARNSGTSLQAAYKGWRQAATEIGAVTSNQRGQSSDEPDTAEEKLQKKDDQMTEVGQPTKKRIEMKALI